MGEFFRGWKRRLGVVTLVMALVTMGGFIRSQSVRDTFNCWAGRETPVLLVSTSGFILWGKVFLDQGTAATYAKFAYWDTEIIADPNSDILVDGSSQLRWFQIIAIESANSSHPFWVISYWCFILPLTALSAYLLLTKPRKLAQKKTTELIANEGA